MVMNRYALDPDMVMAKHTNNDVYDIIRQVLVSPIKREGEVVHPDGKISMEELSKANTTVQTRIVTQLAYNAAQGDVKSAEFLMKYGGYNPPENKEMIDMPQIIDDMSDSLGPAPPSPLALSAAKDDIVIDAEVTEELSSDL